MPEQTPQPQPQSQADAETTPDTITVYLTRAQRDAYLYDWGHHSESDSAALKGLHYAVASRITAIADEAGRRRMRAVVTLTRAQACDLLTYIGYSLSLFGDPKAAGADAAARKAAEKRIAHHEAARKVVRAAGAETIAQFNARHGLPPHPRHPAA
ncbi:hypothetical protein [Streptomyces sp. NBC_00470]|uniref:hypothetical protein n=1 Tax=Streptomyces sp. NBC_00470 TaxID=2975753 RepID=UPI002F90840E